MKLPRPHITVRRLMILVAIVALTTAALVQVAEPLCERRATEFAELERYHRGGRWQWDRRIKQGLHSLPVTTQVRSHHVAMAAKYEWALRYPWLPVWPDPPEPK